MESAPGAGAARAWEKHSEQRTAGARLEGCGQCPCGWPGASSHPVPADWRETVFHCHTLDDEDIGMMATIEAT